MGSRTDTQRLSLGASETAVEKAQTQPRESRDVERHGNNESPSGCSEKSYEVTWDGEDDPQNPRNLPPARKWACVVVVAFSSFCVTNNSAIYTTTYDQIMPLFHTTRVIATLGLSTFVFGLMLGPMILAPLSEFYGRRLVYIGSFSMLFIWIIPCAVAQNIETILVTRFFDGFFGSVFLSVAGGTIGDMFTKDELSAPMMIYSGSPFMGPALAPLIGGFINQYTDWYVMHRFKFSSLFGSAQVIDTSKC